jgi:hypothetical protein
MFINLEALITTVSTQLLSFSDKASPEMIFFACDIASKETGVIFPLNNNIEEFWLVQRSIRYVIADLRLQSSPKFKINSMHLNQRFDHYSKLIEEFDLKFKEALENDPFLFSNMRSEGFSSEAFVTYIPTI